MDGLRYVTERVSIPTMLLNVVVVVSAEAVRLYAAALPSTSIAW